MTVRAEPVYDMHPGLQGECVQATVHVQPVCIFVMCTLARRVRVPVTVHAQPVRGFVVRVWSELLC